MWCWGIDINPSLANVPILYPQKIQEKLCFSGISRRYKMGTLARNGLIYLFQKNFKHSLIYNGKNLDKISNSREIPSTLTH